MESRLGSGVGSEVCARVCGEGACAVDPSKKTSHAGRRSPVAFSRRYTIAATAAPVAILAVLAAPVATVAAVAAPVAILAAAVAVLVAEAGELRGREAEHARVQRGALARALQPALGTEVAHLGEGGERQQGAPHRGLQRADRGRREQIITLLENVETRLEKST